jgi:hypothetical protein
MTFRLAPMRTLAAAVTLTAAVAAPALAGGADAPTFRRIASVPVFLNTSIDVETVAEIVSATADGNTLVYTDSAQELIGYIDITDPANPVAAGTTDLGGEPTAVSVTADGYALVGVNTSPDFVNPSGNLAIVDVATQTIVRTIDLGGQPDSVAISPDGRYAAICIENERDEDLGDGRPPQLPAGYLVIVDLVGDVADWTTRTVELTGVADLFPEDPEPEFVDISKANIAAVTLQENNHIVLVNLVTGQIVADWSAGTVSLDGVDTNENDLIEQTGSFTDLPREPDAISWVGPLVLATADEGDLDGGTRGFTTFLSPGNTLFESGVAVENIATRLGHYPEDRSENKGTEPEGIEFGQYADTDYLFVGAERANLVLVYEIRRLPQLTNFPPFFGALQPRFVQALPTGSGPEGLLAIPSRDLFVVAAENDDRGDALRSTLSIYQRNAAPNYPTVVSADRTKGTAIPWAALSGLAVDPNDAGTAYTIHDSFYQQSRVYGLDVSSVPATITSEIVMNDADGVLLNALVALKKQLPGTDDFDPASIVNADGTVNLDLEGVTVDPTGAVWVCSEGTGNLADGVSDPEDRPFERPNIIARINAKGVIDFVAFPPIAVTRNQFRFGFEGIAAVDLGKAGVRVAVAFQRAWTGTGDPSDTARIGLLDPATGEWSFAAYPLDAVASANGGWVGLGDLVSYDGQLVVVERDNQGGPDAAIKRLYSVAFDLADFGPDSENPAKDFVVLEKTLVRDILAAGDYDVTGGLVPEKLEGMMIMPDGTVWIVNDNDGVDDNSGETQLLNLGVLFD